jgi:hypothetical protein
MLTADNIGIIWTFGGIILGFYLFVAIVTMGIAAIRSFLSNV